MPRPGRIATAALLGGGVALSSFYGVLIGQTLIARRMIGTTADRPPSPEGVYGDDLPGRTVRCLVLGDSAAVGYGMTRADATPPAMIGIGLAHVLDCPVEVRSVPVVGAKSSDLMEQIDSVGDFRPDVTIIVVGTNDVTHQVWPPTAARTLGDVVRRLRAEGSDVVVGTCPDLGTVRSLKQPLRGVAGALSRDLARRQTIAVVRAGGRAVSLGDLLGEMFTLRHDVMFGHDRFHPSETGYANMVSVLVPAAAASLRESELNDVYASTFSTQPRDLMLVPEAAAEAVAHAGTQVAPQQPGRRGRWATVLRRRRAA